MSKTGFFADLWALIGGGLNPDRPVVPPSPHQKEKKMNTKGAGKSGKKYIRMHRDKFQVRLNCYGYLTSFGSFDTLNQAVRKRNSVARTHGIHIPRGM
jgi:hypothetical protein